MKDAMCRLPFDRRIPAKAKGRVYRTAVRPALAYYMEMAALTKRQAEQLATAEMKMLRFILSVTKLDKVRNEYIRGTAGVRKLGDELCNSNYGIYFLRKS